MTRVRFSFHDEYREIEIPDWVYDDEDEDAVEEYLLDRFFESFNPNDLSVTVDW